MTDASGMPHWAIGSLPATDLRRVRTSGINRRWARAVLRRQREVIAALTGREPPAAGPTPADAVPPELIPLLREGGGRNAPPSRFRYVVVLKKLGGFGIQVPAIGGSPSVKAQPYADELAAAWAVYDALGGAIPPPKGQVQRERRKRARAEAGPRPNPYRKGKEPAAVAPPSPPTCEVTRLRGDRWRARVVVATYPEFDAVFDSRPEAERAVAARTTEIGAGAGCESHGKAARDG